MSIEIKNFIEIAINQIIEAIISVNNESDYIKANFPETITIEMSIVTLESNPDKIRIANKNDKPEYISRVNITIPLSYYPWKKNKY